MAVKRGGLGKGLDSLIPDNGKVPESGKKVKVVEKVIEKIVEKPVDVKLGINQIEPNREQPRKKFDEESLEELADSIRQFGVLQPLIVQERKDYYEIIAGERRWRAAKLAGLKELPVIIKKMSDQEIVEISLIENIQRENLNPIEEAAAYKRLLTEFHLKQEEVAERVAKSRTAVTNSMRLLKLDERVQQMVIDGMLTTGHARALLAIEDPELQFQAASRVYNERLSVREVEKMVKNIGKEKPVKKQEDFQQIERLLSENPKIVAVGECGLDYDRMFSTKENQIRCLEKHIVIAEKLNKPLFLHERSASGDFIRRFKKHPDICAKSVVHCFTGDKATLEQYLAMGFSIGITGWICDEKRSKELREAVRLIPPDRILVETDAPYLAPKNVSGLDRVNVPQNIVYVVRELAKHMKVAEDELVEHARKNTERIFGIKREE